MDTTPIGPLERPPAPRPIGNRGGRRGKGAFDDLLRHDSRPDGGEQDSRDGEGRRSELLQRRHRFVRRDDQDGATHVDVMA